MMKAKQLAKENIMSVVCKDGPFKGQRLRLSVEGKTLTFTVRGQTGYYDRGGWHALS